LTNSGTNSIPEEEVKASVPQQLKHIEIAGMQAGTHLVLQSASGEPHHKLPNL
jgi:hypothetical protein